MHDRVAPGLPEQWRLKEVKAAARLSFRTNVTNCAIVSLLGAALIWPVISPSAIVTTSHDVLDAIFRLVGWSRGEAFLADAQSDIDRLKSWTSLGKDSDAGVIAGVYNDVESSGSIAKALLYAISHAILQLNLSASVIAILAVLVTIAVSLWLRTPLRVGGLRFYTETRIYPATPVTRLLFVFRHHRTWAIGVAGLYKICWLVLWGLTIVMLPVKYYSYLMYEYILAENPEAGPRQALKLSQAMMKGNRWRAFLLDLSFLGWYVLGLLTFGVMIYFYAAPYRNLTRAELFVRLRQACHARGVGRDICNDPCLVDPPLADEPVNGVLAVYPDPHIKPHHLVHVDPDHRYSWANLVLIFFCFSFIGWVYESVMSLAYVGKLVNRGVMYGPWLPIYGSGGVAALLFLKRLRRHPVWTFFAAMVTCGIIEFLAAVIIQAVTGLQYWSYQGYFFNIEGRVCLEGMLVFGLGCTAAIYLLAPILDTWFSRVRLNLRYWIIAALLTGFVIDLVMTAIFPRTGFGLTS